MAIDSHDLKASLDTPHVNCSTQALPSAVTHATARALRRPLRDLHRRGIDRSLASCLDLIDVAVRVDERCLRDQRLDHVHDVALRVSKGFSALLDGDGVAMTILVLQVVWTAIDDKTSIDHDSNLVTELLSFVHSVSGQQDRCLSHLLDHLVERTARDWVDTGCRLIEEEDTWVEHDRLSAAQFTLIAATQILSQRVLEERKV